jgi:polyadenylate-binding protein
MIGTKPLYVSLAQRREVRRQQLESQIAQRNQIRMQQAAAAGLPSGYINGPMYYPPAPGAFPPQGRGIMGYPGQPGMLPPRPRYPPANGQVAGMPMASPYGQAPPQGYGMPAYPRGAPRPPGVRGPGTSPTIPNAPIPRAAVPPPPPNGASRAAVPPPPGRAPIPGPPPPVARAPLPQNYKLNPQTRNAGPATNGASLAQAPVPIQVPEMPTLTAAALANASPMEQKQMLGEVIYMRIAGTHPELAGKITGMLLEMDNSELLHLLDNHDAMQGKVNEALTVLQEFSKDG